ncbi:hypothetical protein KKC15_06600 [bacterium]|nr:hypothetical protein [bacterium]
MSLQDLMLAMKYSDFAQQSQTLVSEFSIDVYSLCLMGLVVTIFAGFLVIVVDSHKYPLLDEFIDRVF